MVTRRVRPDRQSTVHGGRQLQNRSRSSASSMSAVRPQTKTAQYEDHLTVSKSMPGASATPVSASTCRHQAVESSVRCPISRVGVERAVGGREVGDADLRQPAQQHLPVDGVAAHVAVEFGLRLVGERRDRGVLRDGRRAHGHIRRQPLQRRGATPAAPASSPAASPVIEKYFDTEPITTDSRDVSHATRRRLLADSRCRDRSRRRSAACRARRTSGRARRVRRGR